jgi:acyl-CoA thioesterase II
MRSTLRCSPCDKAARVVHNRSKCDRTDHQCSWDRSGRWPPMTVSSTMRRLPHPSLGPDQLSIFDRVAAGVRDFRFWDNVESRRPEAETPSCPAERDGPIWRSWLRLRPQATFDDPWIDAARSIVFLDIQGWPAATRVHVDQVAQFVAPSLDLYVAFHEPAPADPWLLADGYCPVGVDGLLGWTGRLWSTRSRLVASGGGQALCRRLPEPTKRD